MPSSKHRKRTARHKARAQNAFSIAVDDETYIKGTRQQQDIDLEHLADDKLNKLLSGEVNDEDDEDIDSDEAYGSSDSIVELDLVEENSEWGDSLDESELLPLSEVWDLNTEENTDLQNSDESKVEKALVPQESDEDSSLEADSESEEADSEKAASDSDFGGWSDENESDIDNHILAEAIKEVATSKQSSNMLNAGIGPENSYVPGSNRSKLTLEDLEVPSETKHKKQKPLGIPLPKRIQDRADRGAAYGLAVEEISKWEDTVKANRRADHLSFPINPKESLDTVTITPVSKPNELEARVQQILAASSLADEQEESLFEESAKSTLSFEELKAKRLQLRQMRELMFREERKAKRIKKIKSKSYHRVHNKDKKHQEALIKAQESGSESSDGESALRQRALERATLKHKASSKWAKQMINQGLTKDASTRQDLEEMLRQGESLRAKIMGGVSDSGSEQESANEPEQEIKAPRKGVMAMKFMQPQSKTLDEPENAGRQQFGPSTNKTRDPDQSEDEEESTKPRYTPPQARQEQDITVENVEVQESNAEPQAIEDSSNPWLSIKGSQKRKESESSGKKAKKSKVLVDVEDVLGDEGLVRANQLTIEQQDLVKRAFSGDNVVAEFDEEKKQEIEEDDDKEVDETLPGWGSWGGEGLEPKKRFVRKVQGIKAHQRKDYKRDNVIINERVNKKNNHYTATSVPFPFENRMQYEQSLRMPVGREWLTRDTFQRQTQPRIIVKRGEVIEPLKHGKA